MSRFKSLCILMLSVSIIAGAAGCKKTGKFSHSSLKSAAKKCDAETFNDVDAFFEKEQAYGTTFFISKTGDEAKRLFDRSVTETSTMPEIKECSCLISTKDAYNFCFIEMTTFENEADANEQYKTNTGLVAGNVIGNDGYKYNLRCSEKDGILILAGAYQKDKTLIYIHCQRQVSNDYTVLEDACAEIGIKSPSVAAEKMKGK